MSNKIEDGKKGEEIAYDYLQKNGYKVIDTNYRCVFGEIDIIAEEDNDIVFIEVKLRKNIEYGHPSEAVNFKKITKITKTALSYIKLKGLKGNNFRFDVVSVCPDNKIELFQSAFDPAGHYTI